MLQKTPYKCRAKQTKNDGYEVVAQSEATLDVISQSNGITITTSTSQPSHASTNIPICPLNVHMQEVATSKDKKDVCGLGTSRGNECNISKGRMLHIRIGPIRITINFISPSYPPYAMIMHIVEPTTIPKFSSSWHWGENDNENGGYCNAIFIINSARDNNSSARHGFCLCVVSLERLIEVFEFRTCKGCCDRNASANFLPTYWHRCHLHIINTLYLPENGWRKICACPLSYPFSYICLKIYTRVPATKLKSQDIETYFLYYSYVQLASAPTSH